MNYLKNLLYEKNISQRELARRTGTNKSTINYYCNGKRKPKDLDIIVNIASVLDVPIAEFIEGIMNDERI